MKFSSTLKKILQLHKHKSNIQCNSLYFKCGRNLKNIADAIINKQTAFSTFQ